MTNEAHNSRCPSRLAIWWRRWIGQDGGRWASGGARSACNIEIGRAGDGALVGKWPDRADLLSRHMEAFRVEPNDTEKSAIPNQE